MTRKQIEEKAEQEWRNQNPSEIDTFFNQEKNNFVNAFLLGFDFAMNNIENVLFEEDENNVDSFGK